MEQAHSRHPIVIEAHDQYYIPERANTLAGYDHTAGFMGHNKIDNKEKSFVIHHKDFIDSFTHTSGKISKNETDVLKHHFEHQTPYWSNVVMYLGHSWVSGQYLMAGRGTHNNDKTISGRAFGKFLAKILPGTNEAVHVVLHACWMDIKKGANDFLKTTFEMWHALPNKRDVRLYIYATKFQSWSGGGGGHGHNDYKMSVRADKDMVGTHYSYDSKQQVWVKSKDKHPYPDTLLPGAGDIRLDTLESIQNAFYDSPKKAFTQQHQQQQNLKKTIFKRYTHDWDQQTGQLVGDIIVARANDPL